MKKYEIHFFIFGGNTNGVERLFDFLPWELNKDFFIHNTGSPFRYKNKLTEGNVSVVILERNCKTDYLPLCKSLNVYSVGNGPECTYSFLKEVKLDKIPEKLYSLCRFLIIQINLMNKSFVNDKEVTKNGLENNNRHTGPTKVSVLDMEEVKNVE